MSRRARPKPRQVIFLDFDGVLNCQWSMAKYGTHLTFDEGSVAALNAILAHAHEAEVVISSSWRYNRTLPVLQVVLDHQGVVGARVTDMTTKWGKDRGSEIKTWLDAQPKDRPIRFIALDDDAEGSEWMGERFIQIDSTCGLRDKHVTRALELLRRA
jgi:hypothetical protein